MSGGQGDAPPPINGGHFLLELLQNPPQHKRTHSQPPAPSTTLPNDPAVAALGPTLPFPSSTFFPPSNGHNNSPYHHQQLAPPPLWPPHHQSTPLPFAPHVFFSQNQNPNPNLNPNPGFSSSLPLPLPLPQQAFNQAQSQQRNIQMNLTPHGGDDIQKLGFLGVNPKPNLNGENLFFGSLHSENRNFSTSLNGKVKEGIAQPGQFEGLDRLGLQNLESAFHNSLNLDRDSRQIMPGLRANEQERSTDRGSRSGYGNQVQSGSYKTLLPPPGFMRSNVNNEYENRRNLDQIINKGKSNLMELNHRNGNSKQFSHGNSIPDTNERETGHDFSDLEEKQELDDLSTEKNDKGKHHARDKDYRCDLRGNKVLSQKNRILRKQIQCRLDIEYMNAGFLGIYKSLIPADEEKAKQKQLFNMLQNHISEEWPNARLFVYGSCDNMFGFSKSDLDVCLEFKDIDVNKTDVLLKLAEILKAKNLEDVQAFTRARVPIVKFMDPETKIWCDICINNTLAEINTKLLRDYAKIDDRVRQLAFLVKHWAKCRGVNETYQGTLSSYAYVIMCIYFLQQRKPAILPCLQEMEPTFSRVVDDVEYAFFDQVEKLNGFGRDSQNVENISKLLWGFFRYWAYCHDYRDDVISVRTLYKMSKRAKEWTRRIGNDRHLICIEDPFETTHDLGRVVDWNSIRVLKEEFERAAYIMQNHPDPCVELFKSYNSNSKRN